MTHAVLLALLAALGQDVTIASDEFVARGAGVATTVHVYEHNLLGPTIQMGRYGRTLRGRAFGAATELSWDDQRVTGLSGGAPVNLAFRVEEDGALHLDGMYAGNLTHLEIGPFGIKGHIGPREMAMEARQGVFVSQLPTPFEVEIPQTLARREVGEQAATLSILLAGFAGPSTEPVVPAPRVLPRIAARHTMPVAPQTPFRVTPPEGWPRPLTMAPIGGPVSGGGGGHIGWKSVSGTNAPPQGSGDRVPRHSGMQ